MQIKLVDNNFECKYNTDIYLLLRKVCLDKFITNEMQLSIIKSFYFVLYFRYFQSMAKLSSK